jgi:hypothetical protein
MAPKFVAPYRKSGKNDGKDAEAIYEAVTRPNVRLQARAACGASTCKPLFGGMVTDLPREAERGPKLRLPAELLDELICLK